jgi:hypothetical protein
VVLVSCGGGGGNGAPTDGTRPDPFTETHRTDLYFGYYGNSPGQTAATFDHTNLCWAAPWGGRDVQIGYVQECALRKIPVMLDLTWLLISGRSYVGTEKAVPQVRQYLDQLRDLGVVGGIVALYPVDEPDMNLDDVSVVQTINRDLRAVLTDLDLAVKLAVIYGNQGTPGIESFDWIARDDYERGLQTLPLLPHQRLMLVAGGADKYRNRPESFEAYANAHPEVVAIVAFIYDDYTDPGGTFRLGISHNGLLPAYRAMGCRLTAKC